MAQGRETVFTEDQIRQIEELAARFWTKSEIAAHFHISINNFKKHFDNNYLKGREQGKGKLRDLQMDAAKKGNVTMLIWLGKNYLGQSDNKELDVIGELNHKIEFVKEQ